MKELTKNWHQLKQDYRWNINNYFQWLQLISSIHKKIKAIYATIQTGNHVKNLIVHDKPFDKRLKDPGPKNSNIKGTI